MAHVQILSNFCRSPTYHAAIAEFPLEHKATDTGNEPTINHQSQKQQEVGQLLVQSFFATPDCTLRRMAKCTTHQGHTHITTIAPTSTTINQTSINQSLGTQKTICWDIIPFIKQLTTTRQNINQPHYYYYYNGW
jgi:hypothetical protein